MSKIEGKLDYAAGELSGLESDSEAGDVNDALGYVREVESYVNDLSRVKGSDSTASNIVSYYPRTPRTSPAPPMSCASSPSRWAARARTS